MKVLHSADWHLDSPIIGRTPEQTALLKSALLDIPHKVMAAAREQQCDLVLLSGDLFDGIHTTQSLRALQDALRETTVPVCIAPGNHDFVSPTSPWMTEIWPEHVHIFTSETVESIAFPELECRVYGAAFRGPDAPAMLEGFCARGRERFLLGVLHGDPTQAASPYCAVTPAQIRESALDYLALGHIHKGDRLCMGDTLCAWPGCPMGRGFDELGPKGVLVATLDDAGCRAEFVALDTPRFYELTCDVSGGAEETLTRLLPAAQTQDFYRVILTGEWDTPDLDKLEKLFPHIPNLILRDRTEPPLDLWAGVGEDTLEGTYFRLLKEQLEGADEKTREQILLAARISRRILENREVKLP